MSPRTTRSTSGRYRFFIAAAKTNEFCVTTGLVEGSDSMRLILASIVDLLLALWLILGSLPVGGTQRNSAVAAEPRGGAAAELGTSEATIRVTNDFLQNGTINPMQYGQFIEYLCNLVPSMWAEKLFDSGFEGLTPYNVEFIKQTDFHEQPWHPSGATARAEYQLDTNQPVSGKVCQRIAVSEGPPCTVGISQQGIAVRRGGSCTFRCWFRQQKIRGPVRVQLVSAGKELASAEFLPDEGWKRFTSVLVPADTATDATLTISFRGAGTLWLDNASLMPDDAIDGWRPDVVAAVKALHPAVIRFGGSALDSEGYGGFDWIEIDRRPGQTQAIPRLGWIAADGAGVGRNRAVLPARRGRTAASASAPPDERPTTRPRKSSISTVSPTRRWAGSGPVNGHPEPYHVKFWQVGNERTGAEYEQQLAGLLQGDAAGPIRRPRFSRATRHPACCGRLAT